MGRLFTFDLSWVVGLLVVAWTAGRLLGDRNLWTGLLFYIPTPVVIAALVAGAFLLRRRDRLRAVLFLAVAFLSTAYWAASEIRWTRSPEPAIDPDGEIYTLVHWNVFRDFLPWKPRIERLRATGADLFVLNELPRQITRGNWALRLGPNMDYAQAEQMIVACRGRVTDREFLVEPGLLALFVDCEMLSGRSLRILAVDMAADPAMARDPVLARLVERIRERRPDLIAGDFNAPRRSRRLRRLPEGYRHAYETVGAGWPYTWPVPLPLLAIDQCITGPGVVPLHHRYESTPWSDHRLQVLRFHHAPSPNTG